MKSRLRKLFDRPEKIAWEANCKDGGGVEFEPTSVCLAKMVQNFIEESNEKQPSSAVATKSNRNRCNCFNATGDESSDDEFDEFGVFGEPNPSGPSGYDSSVTLMLKSFMSGACVTERNLLAEATKILENNKIQKRKDDLRKILTDGLSSLGYDSSICKSKWEKSSSFPAGMDQGSDESESTTARIQQLQRERDELRKDIEQLCIQQAGPSYLVVATKMHFQRTASLEQEIENLKMKLTKCNRDNQNLQEELSEAYRVKGQLANLHNTEVSKNLEAEKQLKFFQSCVAAAFAERDHSIMEAEKAKEKEEVLSDEYNEVQKRLEDLSKEFLELKELSAAQQVNLAKQEENNENFKKVVDKFYEIRQQPLDGSDDASWDNKCACLLHDSAEWSYNDTSTSKYISSLEERLETMKISVDNRQSKLQMGLQIENHLKKKVSELEKKQILVVELVKSKISELRQYHSQYGAHIMNLLDEGKSHISSIINYIGENNELFDGSKLQNSRDFRRDQKPEEDDFRDVHITIDGERSGPGVLAVGDRKIDTSEALTQALQEKVATLLLLSQQEERHLLERNVGVALQKKIEELQRNLLQVTNEKVKALLELAEIKQAYQILKENIGDNARLGTNILEKKLVSNEKDGKLRSLLKRTYLRRWIGAQDFSGNEDGGHLDSNKKCNNLEFARMQIENATLKETIESMEHLTSSIQRLRLSLQEAAEVATSEDTVPGATEALDDIIYEAKLIKTALGSSLPLSWSAEADFGPHIPGDIHGHSSTEKIDPVSAVGFEMVELLIFAAQLLKDYSVRD